MTGATVSSSPALPSWFSEVPFDSAKTLLAVLDPMSAAWSTDRIGRSAWLFRGQWDSRWPLVPRLFRIPRDPLVQAVITDLTRHITLACTRVNYHPSGLQEVLELSAAEKEIVEQFRSLADAVGHNVGNQWSHTGAEWLDGYEGYRSHEYCNPHLVTAIAQHHGMPTRALDWTSHPYHAAFFALSPPGPIDPTASSLAVWALVRDCIASRTKPSKQLNELFCPANQVQFLRAQHGYLVFHRNANHYYIEHGKWPCVIDSITETVAKMGGPPLSKLLMKFTLPHSEIPELKKLLAALRITQAFLMPSLDNVARTIRDSWS